MNVARTIAAVVIGVLLAELLLARAAEDAPTGKPPAAAAGQTTKRTVVQPPRWRKQIAAWKAKNKHEPADNYFCLVCHLNYEEEALVDSHRAIGVGCEMCHGISDKHSEDEDNITPPDIMFPKPHIVPYCTTCHDKNKLLEEEEHRKLFAAKSNNESAKTCTDCHGMKHRLEVRTRRWDKITGKLTWSDGVRMMEEGPEADKPEELKKLKPK